MDQPVDSFEDLARHYCNLLEAETPVEASLFARDCLILLLRLYEGAMRLPDIDTCPERAPRTSHETWQPMFDSIPARLPGRDSYWTIADGIADIWRDLKAGLFLIDKGGPNDRNSAIWHWRFSFESHWGRHAVESITALHALCVDSSSRVGSF
jgi:hypothetical protein